MCVFTAPPLAFLQRDSFRPPFRNLPRRARFSVALLQVVSLLPVAGGVGELSLSVINAPFLAPPWAGVSGSHVLPSDDAGKHLKCRTLWFTRFASRTFSLRTCHDVWTTSGFQRRLDMGHVLTRFFVDRRSLVRYVVNSRSPLLSY